MLTILVASTNDWDDLSSPPQPWYLTRQILGFPVSGIFSSPTGSDADDLPPVKSQAGATNGEG